jgi:hypothetical protein
MQNKVTACKVIKRVNDYLLQQHQKVNLSPFSKWPKGTGAGALHANSEKLELIACDIPITLDNL